MSLNPEDICLVDIQSPPGVLQKIEISLDFQSPAGFAGFVNSGESGIKPGFGERAVGNPPVEPFQLFAGFPFQEMPGSQGEALDSSDDGVVHENLRRSFLGAEPQKKTQSA